MTYSSFVNLFGPGYEIKKEFEKTCACQIKWITTPDSTLFTSKLALKKDGFKIDVLLGFDQLSIKKLKKLNWENWYNKKTVSKINPSLKNVDSVSLKQLKKIFNKPVKQFVSHQFVPYNWSPMTFFARNTGRNSGEASHSVMGLQDLLDKKFENQISLPSPRFSTVGFQFYYWVWSVFKDKTKDFLKVFKHQLYGLPPSWSTSYALFQRGHVLLSFSHFSSLLYHRQKKQKEFYPLFFKQGHPYQVELAGVSSFCSQCVLGKKFIQFLLSPPAQQILKNKNYMFPVISKASKNNILPTTFKLISYAGLKEF